jgi:hypothetical protein
LNSASRRVETGQGFDFFLDALPFVERVDQQAGLIGIYRYNELAIAYFD